ncbi:MAG: O-antigen ligase family protein [Pseudomonadota bacterium]
MTPGPALPPLAPMAALYMLAVVVPVTMIVGPLALTGLRLMLLVLILPLLAGLLSGRYGRMLPTDWLFLGHAAWIVAALAVNNPDRVVQQAPSVIIEFLGSYLLARATIRTPEMFLRLCRWIVGLVLLLIPFALYETLTGNPPIIRFIAGLPGVTSVGIIDTQGRLGLERVQGVFAHPIHFGLFCSVAFSMAFVALKDISGSTWRWISSALVGGAGFLALSSGALLAVALQCGLIAWAAVFSRAEWRWRLLVGLFALAWITIDLLSNRDPLRVMMSYATFSPHNAYIRSIIFEWGFQNVVQSPIFGIGLNDWFRPAFLHGDSVDNFWLLTAMRYGFPGVILLGLGWFAMLVSVMRRPFARDSVTGRVRRAYVFTFIGLTLTLCTVHIWVNIYAFVFFLLGAGAWMIDHSEEAKATRAEPEPRAPRFTRFPEGAAPGHARAKA